VLSDEHFTVDGTLIEAWANRPQLRGETGSAAAGHGARGRKLLRDTHESKTDPEARLFRRSQAAESRPSYLGHVITENRNGLVMAACVDPVEHQGGAGSGAGHAAANQRRPATDHAGGRQGISGRAFPSGVAGAASVPHVAEYAVASRHWPNWLRAESGKIPALCKVSRNENEWSKCSAGSNT